MRVITIKPRNGDRDFGEVAVIDVEKPASLETWQALVGGYIQAVPTSIFGCSMLIDEEGKMKGYERNVAATRLVPGLMPGDTIVGTAVLVGTSHGGDFSEPPESAFLSFGIRSKDDRRTRVLTARDRLD